MRYRKSRRGRAEPDAPGRQTRVNEAIRAREVRVIDEDGTQLGTMPPQEALEIARNKGLDLVEVAPQADPPVVRIMDYSKYKYDQEKRARQARKSQKHVEVKEIRLKPSMAEHDIEYRIRHAAEFLREGNKVRVTVRFFGREIVHTELGEELLRRFADALGGAAVVEQPPRLDGRQMTLMLAPSPEIASAR